MMIKWIWILPVVSMLAMGGCAKELTAGGQREGEVTTAVTDEDDAAAPARYSNAAGESAPQLVGGTLSGSVQVRLSVSLIHELGARVPVTSGVVAASVPVGSSTLVPIGRAQAEIGFYPTVRLHFEEVTAEVSGLDLVAGTFSGAVGVELGSAGLVLDVPAGVEVEEAGTAAIVVELNSVDWLQLGEVPVGSVPPRLTVPAAAFAEAVEVTVR